MPAGQWVYLQKEVPYPAAWQEGAREAGRRQRAQSRYVADLARDAPRIDPVATKLRWGGRMPPVEVGAPSVIVDPGGEFTPITPAREASPEPETSAAARRLAREMAITARLERRLTRDA